MHEIDLEIPSSLKAVLEFLEKEKNIKPIAGGTDLLPLFHKEAQIEQLKAQPISCIRELKLVDLSNLDELRGIKKLKNYIEIGSCTTHAEIASDAVIKRYYPVLVEATSKIGSPQIRNKGTIGGNIANASPAADTVPPLMVLNAELELLSVNGIRKLLLEDFFLGPGKTVLKANEIINKCILPLPHQDKIQFYRRIAARKFHACAKASVAFCAIKENTVLKHVRLAFGAVGSTVIVAYRTAEILEGKKLTSTLIEQALQQAMNETNPIDDIRSTMEYRRAMIGELLKQELERLLNIHS